MTKEEKGKMGIPLEQNIVVVRNHIRAKGVPKECQKDLTFEKFEDMLFNQTPMKFHGKRLAENFKKMKEPAIKTQLKKTK